MVPEPRSAYAFQFFLLAATLLTIGGALAVGLAKLIPDSPLRPENEFSIAFGGSSILLFVGSGCLWRAVESVRRERQARFRLWLVRALTAGTLFVGVQTFALSRLIRQQPAAEAETGAAAFAAVFATLHGIHFVVALLFLCYVTVQALADRYDHEYYWGVTVCTYFWHALGLAWIAILFVMLTARFFS